MNILLLGNGFDLYHKLPTRYDNFLHTIDFLLKYYTPEMATIADIFGNDILQEEDKFIADCYNQHKEAYAKTALNKETIKEIIELAKKNKWFHYLLQSFDKQTGWIDFEKEIAYVVKKFQALLSLDGAFFESNEIVSKLDSDGEYIIQQFDDIIALLPHKNSAYGEAKQITPKYRKEYPLKSKKFIINKKKIADFLVDELIAFAKLLKCYLQIFIENSFKEIKAKSLECCNAITKIDKIISFNYTNSYEYFYNNQPVFHIHGKLEKDIILGINSDGSDNIETINTSLVQFKKYFQRARYDFDNAYIKWMQNEKKRHEHYWLIVMGHSLDITDKDVIVELFNKADEITILYHKETAQVEYISNLIEIFGKERFEKYRKVKNLKFMALGSSDIAELPEKLNKNAYGEKAKRNYQVVY